ncbi:MAG: haloacid dehalogenase-like hydrolase, partial [Nanoarchaeota archaeon]
MERFDAVIFDLDGTLFDSFDEAWRAITTAAERVPELRFIKNKRQFTALYSGNFYEQVCRHNRIPMRKSKALERRLCRTFVDDYNPEFIIPMKDVLKKLRHSHTLVVLS